jgi:hypothetical protein
MCCVREQDGALLVVTKFDLVFAIEVIYNRRKWRCSVFGKLTQICHDLAVFPCWLGQDRRWDGSKCGDTMLDNVRTCRRLKRSLLITVFCLYVNDIGVEIYISSMTFIATGWILVQAYMAVSRGKFTDPKAPSPVRISRFNQFAFPCDLQ